MLNLYNSYTKQQEAVNLNEEDVRIYLCGPTVQSSPHLGHGRSAVVFDFFIRYLKHLNYSVLYVRNITDIDDKIIQKSQEKNINYRELAESVWEEFVQAHENLNCLVPDIEPRATAYVPEIVQYIDQLINNGYGYITKSGVYYDVSKFDDYLKLSGRSTEEVKTGTRIETEEDKKSPEDFALWKFSKEGEPSWDSPWGVGRPGWHIECSTMINQTLGKTIDFHCGGIDLIFPHHENEIAQSCCSTANIDDPTSYAKYWMHNGFVTIEGEKMSKSLGNIILVNELTDSYHGEVIRLALLSSHYRQSLDWNEKIIYQSSKLLDKLYEIKKDLKNEKTSKINHKNTDVISALADDLNTPELIVKLNKIIKEYNSSNKDKQKTKDQLDLISEALGILKDDSYKKVSQELEEKINTLIADRTKAKINRNYDLADKIRKELTDLGVEIKDTSDGTDWNLKI